MANMIEPVDPRAGSNQQIRITVDVRFGAARRDRIGIAIDLLHNGGHYAAFLVYRPADY